MIDQPTPEDWMKVGNDLKVVLNDIAPSLGRPPIPLLDHPTRIPTDEELAAYDRVRPGLADQLREMARAEMEHRKRLEG